MAAGGRGWQCPPHFSQPSQWSLSSGRCLKTWSLLMQQGSLGCAPATERPRRVFSPEGLWGIETLISCRIWHLLSLVDCEGWEAQVGAAGWPGFWLRVSREVVIDLFPELLSSEGWSGAAGSDSTMARSHGGWQEAPVLTEWSLHRAACMSSPHGSCFPE